MILVMFFTGLVDFMSCYLCEIWQFVHANRVSIVVSMYDLHILIGSFHTVKPWNDHNLLTISLNIVVNDKFDSWCSYCHTQKYLLLMSPANNLLY